MEFNHKSKHVKSLVSRLLNSRSNAQESWHQRKVQLDQCRLLHLFEKDIEEVRLVELSPPRRGHAIGERVDTGCRVVRYILWHHIQ